MTNEKQPAHDPEECFTCHFYWPCQASAENRTNEGLEAA